MAYLVYFAICEVPIGILLLVAALSDFSAFNSMKLLAGGFVALALSVCAIAVLWSGRLSG